MKLKGYQVFIGYHRRKGYAMKGNPVYYLFLLWHNIIAVNKIIFILWIKALKNRMRLLPNHLVPPHMRHL
jgi:hypothetical protein